MNEVTKETSKKSLSSTKADKLVLRNFLVNQITKKHNLEFLVYFLSEKELFRGDHSKGALDRVGPCVAVMIAWSDEDQRFLRSVAICSEKETPNRLEGFNQVAKRLLRAIREGETQIYIDSNNTWLNKIYTKLLDNQLVFKREVTDLNGKFETQ